MQAHLFLKKLDFYSGTGQLLCTQVHALRAANVDAILACERGALRYFLRTGIRTRRTSVGAMRSRARDGDVIVVDHNLAIPEADVIFVHNLATDANRYLVNTDVQGAAAEREVTVAFSLRGLSEALEALSRESVN